MPKPSTSSGGETPRSALATPKARKINFQRYKKKNNIVKCLICEGLHKACDCPENPRQKKSIHVATALTTSVNRNNTKIGF